VALYNNPSSPLVQPLLVAVTGSTPTSNNSLYSESSPINFISSQSPPTMILHGGTDIIVPSSQSDLLNARLISAGVTRQYLSYPTEGHGWFGATLSDSFDKIQAFLAANVQ
jgi:dipeptidyl aminopeptidase/acylaminoacyl peptidase